MKRNPWNLVTVVLFALLLLAVPLAFLLLPYRTFSDAERRYLADAPKLGEQDLSDWSYDDKVETFLADHLPLRNGKRAYLHIGIYINIKVFKNVKGFSVHFFFVYNC